MPARLRMQMIRTHGGDPVDFELWCLAVSVLAAVRIASVIHALTVVV